MSASFFIQTSYFYRLIYLKCLDIQQLNNNKNYIFIKNLHFFGIYKTI